MSSKNKRKIRTELFNLYSKSFSVCFQQFEKKYACPLCLNIFDESAIDRLHPLLTLEHCIPDGLCAPQFVLTCKQCNSTGGHQIDHHLHEFIKFDQAWTGHGITQDVKLHLGENTIAAEFERRTDGMHLRIHEKRSNPKAVESFKIAIEDKSLSEFGITARAPSHRYRNLSLLRCAYLLMFRNLGFQYIFSSSLDVVRRQIEEPASLLLNLDNLVLSLDDSTAADGLYLIRQPNEVDGYLVHINLKKFGKSYGVVMPTSPSTYSSWTDWGNHHSEPPKLTFIPHPFDTENLLSTENKWS